MNIIIKSSIMVMKGYFCNACKRKAGVIFLRSVKYCPYCGSSNIKKGKGIGIALKEDLICKYDPETPEEIVKTIKEEYHGNGDEEIMEDLLNKLKDLAERKVKK